MVVPLVAAALEVDVAHLVHGSPPCRRPDPPEIVEVAPRVRHLADPHEADGDDRDGRAATRAGTGRRRPSSRRSSTWLDAGRRGRRSRQARTAARAAGSTEVEVEVRDRARRPVVGWSRNSNSVTTPKLPPPPRRPQNRSGCSVALARTDPAIRRDDRVRLDVVARQAELAGKPAHPATERQPADARVRDVARRRRQAVRLGRPIEAAAAARRRRPMPVAGPGRRGPRPSATGRSSGRRPGRTARGCRARRIARRSRGRPPGRGGPPRRRRRPTCSAR